MSSSSGLSEGAPKSGVETDVAADVNYQHDAPYTDTFWSIAEAVTWRENRTMDISVAKFAAELKRRGYRVAAIAKAEGRS